MIPYGLPDANGADTKPTVRGIEPIPPCLLGYVIFVDVVEVCSYLCNGFAVLGDSFARH